MQILTLKIKSSALYYPGYVFDFKKILAQAIALQKDMHNLTWKGEEKKIHTPENFPTTPTPPSLKKIMVNP